MSIISRLREHLLTCPLLESGPPLHVDGLGPDPVNYAIQPLAGEVIAEEYMDGSSLRRFPFAFSAMRWAREDGDRMEACGWMADLAQWMEAAPLPPLDEGQRAQRLRAVERATLQESAGGNAARVYRMKCELEYFEN